MRTRIPTVRSLALAGAFALCGVAQAHDDPIQADGEGRQSALTTLQKEIGAAYDEAQRACAKSSANERGACLQKARQARDEDMKGAAAQVRAAGSMGSVTTTRITTVGDASSTSVTTTPATAEPGVQ